MNLKLTRFTFQTLLAVLLLVGAIPAKAAQSGDFTYTATATAVTISGYTGTGGAVTIPSAIGGLPVTGIGNNAFYNKTTLTSVTIPNSVTSIGSSAFQGCSGLTSMTIPNSVTSIGDYAFRECKGLTSVTIPNSVTSIGSQAFQNCSGLTSVTIGNGVTSIEYGTFLGCSILTSVTIGSGVTSIGVSAFNSCTGLASVTIPNSVTTIESNAFQYCLTLTSVTIGNGATSIGSGAFDGCNSLASVTVDAANPNYSSMAGVFFNKNQSTLIQYPQSKTGSYTIPDSVTSIGVNAFKSCTSLTSVSIPNSVTSIGSKAFSHCSLTSVTIGNGVTSIESLAFRSCIGLTSVTIPNSVTNIGEGAFLNCINLARIYFEGNAPTAGVAIFNYASPSIYYYAGTTGWGISFAGLPTAEALTFISQPANVVCNQGRRATFSVSTTGAGVAYQWQKGGADIPNATAATLTLTNVQAADVGNYTVVARNLEGSFTSASASLVVYPDADGDGLTNADELIYGSNVNQGDTDGDGISDGDEVHRYLTNPTVKDTDGDGYEDGFEIGVGYSPTSATSTPQAVSRIHPAVEFEFSADLGVAYQIQQSFDLQNWTPIESNIIGQGRVETRFYSTQNQPKRYFRVNRY